MVDRLTLLEQVVRVASLDTSTREGVRKGLDAALAAALPALPLDAARRLPGPVIEDLDLVLRDTLDRKAVEVLAKAWEPTRKVEPDQKVALRADLSDLLRGRRTLYAAPAIGLEAARALGAQQRAALKDLLVRLAPSADLKKLLTKWDKHLKPTPTTRADRLARLSALIDGAPITPAPPKPARRR